MSELGKEGREEHSRQRESSPCRGQEAGGSSTGRHDGYLPSAVAWKSPVLGF